MRFYDKQGMKHTSLFGAYFADVKNAILKKGAQTKEQETTEDKLLTDEEPMKGSFVDPVIDHPDDQEDSVIDVPVVNEEENENSMKIVHDYAHGVLKLVNKKTGEVITSSPLDGRLLKNTTDKALMEILYPDGNIPDEVCTNLESIDKEYIEKEYIEVDLIPAAASYTCMCGTLKSPTPTHNVCDICGTMCNEPSNLPYGEEPTTEGGSVG